MKSRNRTLPDLALFALGVGLAGGLGLLAVRALHGKLAADQRWLASEAVGASAARHPTLVASAGRVLIFWTDGAPTLTSEDCGPFSGQVGGGNYHWSLSWADITTYQGRRTKRQGSVVLSLVHAGGRGHRPALCGTSSSLLVIHPRHIWDSRQGTEAAVQRIDSPVPQLTPVKALLSAAPLAVLPHSLVGAQASATPAAGSTRAKWFMYPTRRDRDFRRMDLCRDPQGKAYFLCGEDHISGAIWVTRSDDGKAWADPTVLAHDVCFPAIAAREDRVLVTYTDAGESSYLNQWPDDVPVGASGKPSSPRRGVLRCRLSADGGQTWGEPRDIPKATDVVSSRCVWGRDGRLWVAYVKWLTRTMTAALYLTQSSDGGDSWTAPEQITSGEWVDRDVDIALADKELIVAFSRCRRPGTPSSLWIWQEPTETTM